MKDINLVRIDSRLSHGKVVSYWTDYLKADTVIIANDRVAEDDFERSVMDLTIPKDIKAHYLSLKEVRPFIKENKDEQVFLIVESPRDLERIMEDGVTVDRVNIGIIHLSPGKKLLTEEVAVDKKDLDILSNLVSNNTEVFVQLSPFSCKRDLRSFFTKA